jgi:hypothetical protein
MRRRRKIFAVVHIHKRAIINQNNIHLRIINRFSLINLYNARASIAISFENPLDRCVKLMGRLFLIIIPRRLTTIKVD